MKEINKNLSIVLIALCFIALLDRNNVKAIGCPEKCTCQMMSVVKCIRQQLKSIPEVPAQIEIM